MDPYAAMADFMMIFIVLTIVFCIIGILLAVWVYKDAQSRDMNAVGWLIIVLLCGCCGCIIYLLVRQPK